MLREPALEPLTDVPDKDGDPDGLLAQAAANALLEAEHHTSAMVALYPDAATAADLALKGGEDADELHMTLAFLGDIGKLAKSDGALKVVKEWAATCPPLEGEVSGRGEFVTDGEGKVDYLSVDLPDLSAQRQRLVEMLDAAGYPASQEHGFQPHITIRFKK